MVGSVLDVADPGPVPGDGNHAVQRSEILAGRDGVAGGDGEVASQVGEGMPGKPAHSASSPGSGAE